MIDLTDDELRAAMAEWMREISNREEHCPLTKPELLRAFRQVADGHEVTVIGDQTIDRKKILVEAGVRREVRLPHHLLPEQIQDIARTCQAHADRKTKAGRDG